MIKLSLLEKKYDAFTAENKNACDFVYDKIKEIADVANCLYTGGKTLDEQLEKLREENETFKMGITEANIKNIKDLVRKKKIYIHGGSTVVYGITNLKLNIFGNISLGESSRSTIDADIARFSSSTGFNLDRHVELSLFSKDRFRMGYCVNVSTILIRAISKYLVSDEKTLADIGHMIKVIILQKWIKYVESSFAIVHNMAHYAPTAVATPNAGVPDKVLMTDYIKMLFVLKVYYNIINHIETSIYSQNVDKLMDLVDNMCMTYSVIDGVERATNVLYGTMSNGYLELRRDIDEMIDKAIEAYRRAIRLTVTDKNGLDVHRFSAVEPNTVDRITHFIARKKNILSVEAVYDIAPDIVGELRDAMEAMEEAYNMPAISSVVGMENVSDYSNMETINAGTRAKILSKFNNKERKTYIKYENDVMRITAKVNNCTSTFSQSAIISDIESISTCINVDINKSYNEEFRLLMQLLDSELRRAGQMVANRNFAKERKTMLYGNIKTLNNWDF